MKDKLWKLSHNEKIEFFAKIAEKYSAEAADEIRSHIKKGRTTKDMVIGYVMENPGKTMAEIADHFNCDTGYIYSCVHRYGLVDYITKAKRAPYKARKR